VIRRGRAAHRGRVRDRYGAGAGNATSCTAILERQIRRRHLIGHGTTDEERGRAGSSSRMSKDRKHSSANARCARFSATESEPGVSQRLAKPAPQGAPS